MDLAFDEEDPVEGFHALIHYDRKEIQWSTNRSQSEHIEMDFASMGASPDLWDSSQEDYGYLRMYPHYVRGRYALHKQGSYYDKYEQT